MQPLNALLVSLCLAADLARTAAGLFIMPARQSGTRCQMNLEILTASIVSNGFWKQSSFLAATSVTSALEVVFLTRCAIKIYVLFIYLLTYSSAWLIKLYVCLVLQSVYHRMRNIVTSCRDLGVTAPSDVLQHVNNIVAKVHQSADASMLSLKKYCGNLSVRAYQHCVSNSDSLALFNVVDNYRISLLEYIFLLNLILLATERTCDL